MSTIPEIIIQKVLVDGFTYIKENNEIIDMVFNNLPQVDVQNLKDILVRTSLAIQLGYAKQKLQLPSVIILLGSEEESHPSLGKFLGKGYDPYNVDYTEDPPHGTSGSLIPKDFFHGTDELNEGTERIGEARKLFKPSDVVTSKVKQRFGSTFTSNYALHIISEDPLLTVFLYNLTKFIILDGILVLEKNGLIDMALSGSDLTPSELTAPDISFERTLYLRFLNTFDFIYGYNKLAKIDVSLNAVSMNVNPTTPCHNISGVKEPPPDTGIISYGIDTYTLIGQPLTIVSMTPYSITVDTEIDIIVDGENIDKDVTVEFLDLEFSELRSGGYYGIRELSRDYVGDNNLRLKVKGYSVGSTRVRFTNPNSAQATWETFYVTS